MTKQTVAEILRDEELELSNIKRQKRYGRRIVGPRLNIILWFLRIYVIIMMALVAYQVWLAFGTKT